MTRKTLNNGSQLPLDSEDDEEPLSKRSVISDISSLNSIKVLDPPDEIRKNLEEEEN